MFLVQFACAWLNIHWSWTIPFGRSICMTMLHFLVQANWSVAVKQRTSCGEQQSRHAAWMGLGPATADGFAASPRSPATSWFSLGYKHQRSSWGDPRMPVRHFGKAPMCRTATPSRMCAPRKGSLRRLVASSFNSRRRDLVVVIMVVCCLASGADETARLSPHNICVCSTTASSATTRQVEATWYAQGPRGVGCQAEGLNIETIQQSVHGVMIWAPMAAS